MASIRPPTSCPKAGASDILLGAALPIANCVFILGLLFFGHYSFPARDMASIGMCFSMMIVWGPLRRMNHSTTSGRIACWTLCLVSGMCMALLLAAGLSH